MHQPPARVPAVLDASFWINTVRMGLVAFVTDYFALAARPGRPRR